MRSNYLLVLAIFLIPSIAFAITAEEEKLGDKLIERDATLPQTLEAEAPKVEVTEAEVTDPEACAEFESEIQATTRHRYTAGQNTDRQPGVCFSSGLLPQIPKKTNSSFTLTQIAESVVLFESKSKLPGEDLLNDLMKRCLGLTGGISVVPQLPIPGVCNIDLKKCDQACTFVTEDKVPPGYHVAASCGSRKSLDDPELDTSCQMIKSSACGDNEPTEIFVHQNSKVNCQTTPAATALNDTDFGAKISDAIDNNKCVGFLAKGGYWASWCRNKRGLLSRLRFGVPTYSCEEIMKDTSKPYKRLVIACESAEAAASIREQLSGGNFANEDQRDACMKLGGATGVNRCEPANQ
jgi:hypothetical protein